MRQLSRDEIQYVSGGNPSTHVLLEAANNVNVPEIAKSIADTVLPFSGFAPLSSTLAGIIECGIFVLVIKSFTS